MRRIGFFVCTVCCCFLIPASCSKPADTSAVKKKRVALVDLHDFYKRF